MEKILLKHISKNLRKLGAELGLGLELALDVTIKYWGWFDFLESSIIDGEILTGCTTVIIGD